MSIGLRPVRHFLHLTPYRIPQHVCNGNNDEWHSPSRTWITEEIETHGSFYQVLDTQVTSSNLHKNLPSIISMTPLP